MNYDLLTLRLSYIIISCNEEDQTGGFYYYEAFNVSQLIILIYKHVLRSSGLFISCLPDALETYIIHFLEYLGLTGS